VTLRPIDALVVVPLALLGLLALARLARVRPAFRPLVGPFAACALAAVVMVFAGPPTGQSPIGLLYLLPVLVLVVRATSLAFQWVFYRRQGSPPPSLLDSQLATLERPDAEEGAGAARLPLLAQRHAVTAFDHVERRRRHPLEAGRVDQHIERIFDAVVHHAFLVDAAHAVRCGVDEMDVRQVEAQMMRFRHTGRRGF